MFQDIDFVSCIVRRDNSGHVKWIQTKFYSIKNFELKWYSFSYWSKLRNSISSHLTCPESPHLTETKNKVWKKFSDLSSEILKTKYVLVALRVGKRKKSNSNQNFIHFYHEAYSTATILPDPILILKIYVPSFVCSWIVSTNWETVLKMLQRRNSGG